MPDLEQPSSRRREINTMMKQTRRDIEDLLQRHSSGRWLLARLRWLILGAVVVAFGVFGAGMSEWPNWARRFLGLTIGLYAIHWLREWWPRKMAIRAAEKRKKQRKWHPPSRRSGQWSMNGKKQTDGKYSKRPSE